MLKKLLFFSYLIAIIIMSLLPPDNLPDLVLFIFADKLIHCCMYSGLTFLMFWAWPNLFNGKKVLLPFLIVVLCGFSMEILQGVFGMGRTFDLWDQFSNMIGFFPGWVSWLLFRKMLDSRRLQNK
jgi:VanZ family protein